MVEMQSRSACVNVL